MFHLLKTCCSLESYRHLFSPSTPSVSLLNLSRPSGPLFLLRSHARAQSINLDSDNPAFCVLLWRLFPSSVVQCLVAQSLCHRCVGCPRSCSSGGGLNCFIAGTATTTDRGILCTSSCSCVGPPQAAYTTSITLCRPCVSHSFSTTQKLTTLSSHRECAI